MKLIYFINLPAHTQTDIFLLKHLIGAYKHIIYTFFQSLQTHNVLSIGGNSLSISQGE